MKQQPRRLLKMSTTMRGLTQRMVFLFLLIAAIIIMLAGNADPRIFERARVIVSDFSSPIIDIMSRPVASIHSLKNEASILLNIRDDNVILRQDNASLLQWKKVAYELITENQQLRALLNYNRKDVMNHITARIIGDVGGSFARNILINAGKDVGVRKGQAAVVGDGLVGRVTIVGSKSSSVLLITDLNSRIPVVIESTRVRAFLDGDNTNLIRLSYLSANSELAIGQRIVTSGHGGVFPPGIPIGIISVINQNGVKVTPYVKSDKLEYIRLMDFGLHGALDDSLVSTKNKIYGNEN